ncbi:uncharacterized protein LOC135848253 isoform X19 [Planococcus citri]|uniref:uncharacterized protein LOC135848253 isoform X19 n=1 Tax=Planococcus citri TaxID=170843 RepID=UPI0031F85510
MAAVISNPFDAISTPITLKEQSALVISLDIWHREIANFRRGGKLKRMRPLSIVAYGEGISLQKILPDLPPVIHNTIDGYVSRFGNSMADWLNDNYKRIFRYDYCTAYDILRDFDDFVGDRYGIIDYVKTAERMMRCDRFDEILKFKIACAYLFEDHIRRIWQSVGRRLAFPVKKHSFTKFPHLNYWICYLRNQTYLLTWDWQEDRGTLEEIMFDANMPRNGPSVEYFWNRLPSEVRLQKAIQLYARDKESFVRFVLPKLNDQELDQFVNQYGNALIRALLETHEYNAVLIVPTWMCMKNAMNESTFTNLAVELLKMEAFRFTTGGEPKNWSYYCTEIWNSVSNNLKQSALKAVLSDKRFLEIMGCPNQTNGRRYIEFFLIILSSATFKERGEFLHKTWRHLIARTRIEDLQRLMQLCFENENEMARFKKSLVADTDHLQQLCLSYLKDAAFLKLNELVSFYFPEMDSAKDFKQRILQFTLFSDDRSFTAIVSKFDKFNDFINGADLSTDFKNQLMTSPEIQLQLSNMACTPFGARVVYGGIMKFIETFASTEQILLQMKNRIMDSIKQSLPAKRFNLTSPFLLWCLGSEEEVEKFKRSYA